jgi:hypothetical protein
MAIRRLVNMINGLAVNRDIASIRNDQGAASPVNPTTSSSEFMIRGRVESTSQQTVTVSTQDGSETAQLATDEPFQAGQMVWCIRADDGTLVVVGSI